MSTEQQSTPFEGWCILEIMGHRRLGGYVREATIAGAGFLRIDVPGDDGSPAATQFYRPDSVYALTPTTEAMARAVAKANRPEPVQRWELPQLRAPQDMGAMPPDMNDDGYLNGDVGDDADDDMP